jgi:sec-independent protein translocase protein TatB
MTVTSLMPKSRGTIRTRSDRSHCKQHFASAIMFDIGFTEIIFIMVITLLVVGPERMPRIARAAGLWLGKLRGFVSSVKADIDKELATEELKKVLEKQASSPELEELVDTMTGIPLQAGERSAAASAKIKPAVTHSAESGTDEKPD